MIRKRTPLDVAIIGDNAQAFATIVGARGFTVDGGPAYVVRKCVIQNSAACLMHWAKHANWDDRDWGKHLRHLTLDEKVCSLAAMNGHSKMLELLLSHGLRWTELTCAAAAERNQLECLRFLRAYNCPWDESTCEIAAYYSSRECLEYAKTHGCPWPMDLEYC